MLIFVIMLVLAISFLIIGPILLYKNIKFVQNAYKTTGQIEDIKVYHKKNNENHYSKRMYAAIIEFKTISGKLIRFESNSSSSFKPKLGKEVKILYYEDKPENAKIDSFFQLYILPIIVIMFGLLMLFLALYLPIETFTQ